MTQDKKPGSSILFYFNQQNIFNYLLTRAHAACYIKTVISSTNNIPEIHRRFSTPLRY